MSVTISPAVLAADPRFRVLDVRWRLDAPDGRAAAAEAHIPGAVYVDLDTELSGPRTPGSGRHPLPTTAALQAAARSWGLCDGDPVVVHDDWNSLAAARAWWLLRDAGIADVRILDGGLAAWRAAGLPLVGGVERPAPGTVTLTSGALPRIDADQAAGHPHLLDARAAERYRGEVEPIDPRAGHIPGAISAPTTGNLAADGAFLTADALRARFAALGVTDSTAVYCGSGVTAAHTIAALAIAGHTAALYPGSWSQWSANPDRPVATGPTP